MVRIYLDFLTEEPWLYFTKSELKKRGWSDRLIDQILGAPDGRQPNPHGKGWTPMLLWRDHRVIEPEQHPDFVAHQGRRAKRAARNDTVSEALREED